MSEGPGSVVAVDIAALEGASDASVMLVAPDATILWLNDSARRSSRAAFGREPAPGDSLLDFATSDTRPGFITNLAKAAAGEAVHVRRRIEYPTGIGFWWEVDYVPVRAHADGPVTGIIFRAGNRSSDVEARARSILFERAVEAAPIGVVIARRVGADHRMVYVNRGFCDMTGYTPDELVGRDCRMLQGEERDQPARARLRDALASQTATSVLIRNYRKDGSPFWNRLTIAPIWDEAGETTHVVGLQQDVSREIGAEAQADAAHEMAMVGAVSAAVAHDVNNLLTFAGITANLLRYPDADLHEAADDLDQFVRRTSATLRELVRHARAPRTRAPVCDLAVELRAIEPMLRATIGSRGTLILAIDDAPVPVRCSRAAFERILVNAVVNARHAIAPGGQVEVGVRRDGPRAVVRIIDDGIGIPAELHATIFERGFSTRGAAGAGLGLATARELAREAGGDLQLVASAPGAGARFEINLPLALDELGEATAAPTPARGTSGHARVLLLEPDPPLRRRIALALEHRGYQVRHHARLHEADLGFAPEVVVADLYADATALAIAPPRELAGVPVLLVSGDLLEPPRILRAPTHGPLGFLRKPFNADELDDALRALVPAPADAT